VRRVIDSAAVKKLAAVIAVFACGAVLRLPTFARPLLSDDEAIYAATADAMRRGDRLYADVVDHKPPYIYYVYAAGFTLFGPYGMQGAHLFVVLAVLLTGAALWRLGERRGGRCDGAVAALLWLVFSTTWHDYDALAANCELFLLLPQAVAALLVVRAWERAPRAVPGTHLAIGVLIGLSALFKYQGFTFLGVSGGLLAWGLRDKRLGWGRAALALGCELLGAAAPAAAFLALGARDGSAQASLFWFRFNFSYIGAGLTGLAALARGLQRLAMIGGVALVPYVLGAAAALATGVAIVRVVRRGDAVALPSPVDVLALAWLLTGIFAASAGGRFFGHYFHLVLAPLCLLGAPRFLALWRRGRGPRFVLGALCALPAAAFFLLATTARSQAAALDEGEPPYQRVAARIAALASPAQSIFVWGNSPQLYVLAERAMGTRFSFCNYMTGESPGTPTETGAADASKNELAVSWTMLFEDLERRRPWLLVDAAAAGWDGYDKFPLARYPQLAAYVASHYARADTVDGVVIYRRSD
jgi:hypothetical protein